MSNLFKYFAPHNVINAAVTTGKKVFGLDDVKMEACFYVESDGDFNRKIVESVIGASATASSLNHPTTFEIGPRINTVPKESSTTVGMLQRCGVENVTRVEKFIRLGVSPKMSLEQIRDFTIPLHDPMMQAVYPESLTTLESGLQPVPVEKIPITRKALKEASKRLGCSFDDQDIEMIIHMYIKVMKRDWATDVEIMTLGQAWAEHCRHGFFGH